MSERSEPLANCSGAAERRAQSALVSVQWRHRHYAFDTQTTQLEPAFAFCAGLAWCKATLCLLACHVDLHEHADGRTSIIADACNRVGKPSAVYGMDEREAVDCLRFVAL